MTRAAMMLASAVSEPDKVPVYVSSRVLRHISRGIYRTPAGALKELISNAYDAHATTVTITTGWPSVDKITITDNGKGMSRVDFKDIVQNIGLSNKRVGESYTIPGTKITRNTIGHYGVGLLAVGQLAKVMRITSKPKDSLLGFTAQLDFDQLEGTTRSTVKSEQKLELLDDGSEKKLPIATCLFWNDEYERNDRDESFTRIELTSVREFVYQHLVGVIAESNPKRHALQRYSAGFQELLELLREQEKGANIGFYPYERLIWEMAVYCPVAYPVVGLFKPVEELAPIARLAKSCDFELVIDGIQIRKPFEETFFSEDTPVEKVWRWPKTTLRDGSSELTATAYLMFKRRIRPKALQGILVRENGVAIGLYDTTHLHYPFNEGMKFHQLTGEIFASGLSGALNVDRNSFNETDDAYLTLCKWYHSKLNEQVFTDIKRLSTGPGAARRSENRMLIESVLNNVLPSQGKIRAVEFDERGKSEPLFAVRGRTLVINANHPDGSGSSSKQEKVILAAALILHGSLSADQYDEIDQHIRRAKKASTKDNS